MLCIAAFFILLIMGIFSATHRELAREAFGCVLHRLTLKPCQSSFQTKVKSGVINWLMKKNMRLASLFNKYAEILAWVFVILTLVSTIYTAYGLYNYFVHGSCTPDNPQACGLSKLNALEKLRVRLFGQPIE